MKIENTSTNFQGLRLKYQKFDHIIRNSNTQYSRISPYRIHMKLGQKYISPKIHDWLREKEDIVDENRRKTSSQDFISIIKNDLENVRNHKLGDCGESSAIVIASLIANAIKNFKIGHLLFDISIYKKQTGEKVAERTVNTTHEFVALNVNDNYQSKNPKSYGKDAIILDSWAGFCGNVQKAFQEFYQIFNNGVRKVESPNGYEYVYKPRLNFYDLGIDVTEDLSKGFAKDYPELVVKNNK